MSEKINIGELVQQLQSELADLRNRFDALESVSRVKPPAKGELPKVEVPEDTFKIGKTEYRFTVAQYRDLNGVLVKAADALKNPAELERLVAIKSGIIAVVK